MKAKSWNALVWKWSSSEVKFYLQYIAQNHNFPWLYNLYSVRLHLSLDPQFGYAKTLLTGNDRPTNHRIYKFHHFWYMYIVKYMWRMWIQEDIEQFNCLQIGPEPHDRLSNLLFQVVLYTTGVAGALTSSGFFKFSVHLENRWSVWCLNKNLMSWKTGISTAEQFG